jgi:DNA-binding transcriptional ArsR family regulator
MTEPFLRLFEQPADKDTERGIIQTFLPETVEILKNPIRAGIINLLVNSPHTGHSMKVEQLAYKLGTYHRIIIYHLERLQKWEIVTVKKISKYGNKTKRSIWGLNLKYPNWILEVHSTMKQSFNPDFLETVCNKNINIRNNFNHIEKDFESGIEKRIGVRDSLSHKLRLGADTNFKRRNQSS